MDSHSSPWNNAPEFLFFSVQLSSCGLKMQSLLHMAKTNFFGNTASFNHLLLIDLTVVNCYMTSVSSVVATNIILNMRKLEVLLRQFCVELICTKCINC